MATLLAHSLLKIRKEILFNPTKWQLILIFFKILVVWIQKMIKIFLRTVISNFMLPIIFSSNWWRCTSKGTIFCPYIIEKFIIRLPSALGEDVWRYEVTRRLVFEGWWSIHAMNCWCLKIFGIYKLEFNCVTLVKLYLKTFWLSEKLFQFSSAPCFEIVDLAKIKLFRWISCWSCKSDLLMLSVMIWSVVCMTKNGFEI